MIAIIEPTRDDAIWTAAIPRDFKGKGKGTPPMFGYLTEKPVGWQSIPLSEEVSIYWDFGASGTDKSVIDQMNQFEHLLDQLCKGEHSRLALTITSPAGREWCFYAKDYDAFMQTLNTCLAGRPRFPIRIEHSSDPDWTYWHSFVDRIRQQK